MNRHTRRSQDEAAVGQFQCSAALFGSGGSMSAGWQFRELEPVLDDSLSVCMDFNLQRDGATNNFRRLPVT
jgi:hypothetical protein